ncbi:MAG: HipA family kinase [Prosthecobacter sp.]|nr:HipA family kinase [Prosthecobacter sp.]
MDAAVDIIEVLGRADQGMTRPFVCRGGFATYFVKGAYAGKRSLCCEWVAGRLIQRVLPSMPLGIPAFAMAQVPRELIEGSARKDIRDLGEGLAFASMQIWDGRELTWSAAQSWSDEIMAMLLLLDLWLQNEDRSLSELGGNPNLLVTQVPPLPDWNEEGALWAGQSRREILWAYDFNLAFDTKFNRQQFFQAHVFGCMLKGWPDGFRERMEPRMQRAVNELPEIFAELPHEWLYLDGDETLAVHLDQEHVYSTLSLPFTNAEAFWTLP